MRMLHRFPRVHLLCNEVNRHYTFSNNWAIDEARGQYLCLLNNDTVVLPEAFDRMLAFLRENPDAGAVGCRLLNEDGSTQWSIKPLPDLGAALFGGRSILIRLFPNNPFSRRRILHLDRDMTKPFTAGYISGAAKMMPRKVIDEVGHLDGRLFYHVDADYCKRITDAGYKCYYLPTAAVIHLNHKGGSMVSLRLRFRSLLSFHTDCYVYYCKHIQRNVWSPMRVVILLGLVFHFLALVAVQASAELVGLMKWPSYPCRRVLEEADGYVHRLDGSPYRVTDRDGGLLVPTDGGSWRALRATLFRHQRRRGAAVRRVSMKELERIPFSLTHIRRA